MLGRAICRLGIAAALAGMLMLPAAASAEEITIGPETFDNTGFFGDGDSHTAASIDTHPVPQPGVLNHIAIELGNLDHSDMNLVLMRPNTTGTYDVITRQQIVDVDRSGAFGPGITVAAPIDPPIPAEAGDVVGLDVPGSSNFPLVDAPPGAVKHLFTPRQTAPGSTYDFNSSTSTLTGRTVGMRLILETGGDPGPDPGPDPEPDPSPDPKPEPSSFDLSVDLIFPDILFDPDPAVGATLWTAMNAGPATSPAHPSSLALSRRDGPALSFEPAGPGLRFGGLEAPFGPACGQEAGTCVIPPLEPVRPFDPDSEDEFPFWFLHDLGGAADGDTLLYELDLPCTAHGEGDPFDRSCPNRRSGEAKVVAAKDTVRAAIKRAKLTALLLAPTGNRSARSLTGAARTRTGVELAVLRIQRGSKPFKGLGAPPGPADLPGTEPDGDKCRWLANRRGRFKKRPSSGDRCDNPRWVKARKAGRRKARGSARGTRYVLKLKKKLPRGRYAIYSRAVDGRTGAAEFSFTKKDGNFAVTRIGGKKKRKR